MPKKNSGKDFESQFKDSVPDNVYFQRIKDPAQSFNQNTFLRFSPTNPYDCFMYSFPFLFTIELKTTKETSMSFYREDFIKQDTKQTFMIKKNQIEGLTESSKYQGIISGFILNFRKYNRTYFIHINDFNNMVSQLEKKSINEKDVIDSNGYLIEQTLKKTNYKFNVEKFINDYKNIYFKEINI